jgi:tRNA(Arg) A34 adenosine deaminase TadA
MDALEYGRIVHAEMSALTDAARCGHSVKGAVLYCTTFPCHMCAKHIVSAGVSKVVFLEPYPKSLAFDLHADSIQVESGDRGHYHEFPAVHFEHFYGVSPRRYREIFERGKRKDDQGALREYRDSVLLAARKILHPRSDTRSEQFQTKANTEARSTPHVINVITPYKWPAPGLDDTQLGESRLPLELHRAQISDRRVPSL